MIDDPNFLSNSPDVIVSKMLSEQPEFNRPDTASLVSPLQPVAPASESLQGNFASARAGRYTFASQHLPDQDYDKGLFTGKIINGQDDELRKQYAAYDAMAKDQLNDEDTRRILTTKLPGEALTPDDVTRISANAVPNQSNPSDVFERRFAQEAVSTATTQPKIDAPHTLIDAAEADPSVAELTTKYAEQAITKQQYAIKKLEEIQNKRGSQGYLDKGIDFAMGLIPFLPDVVTHNAFDQAGGTAILPGNDMDASAQYYYTLPNETYTLSLDQAVEQMSANSLEMTANFLQKIISYSSSDKYWDNYVQPGIDAAITAPGTLLVRPAKAVTKAAAATPIGKLVINMKNTTKAVDSASVSSGQALSALGDVNKGAMEGAIKLADEQAGNIPRVSTLGAIDTEAQTIFKPEYVVGGPVTSNSRPLAQRIATMLQVNTQKFYEDILGKRLNVDRLTGKSFDEAVEATKDIMRNQYAHANDSIIDIKPSDFKSPVANVDFVEAQIGKDINPPMPLAAGHYNPDKDFVDVVIGKTDAQFFDTAGEANNYAKHRLGLQDYSVRQLGDNKYSVVVSKPIDETSVDARMGLDIDTKNNPTPASITNMFLGWARGRAYVVPKELYGDAVVATYGASALSKMAKELYLPVGKLGKREYNDWVKFLEAQRDYTHPTTGQRGKWSATIGDFERDWLTKYGTMPNDKQTMAYFAHAHMSDMDWVIRNLSVYTAKSRKGVENFTLTDLGLPIAPKIEGKYLTELPLDSPERFNFAILDDTTANKQNGLLNSQFISNDSAKGGLSTAEKKAKIKEAIKSGEYKVIQLTDDGERAIKAIPEYQEMFEGHGVDYLLVNNMRTDALGLKHVPYKPGGHVEHTNGTWFMRQPTIRVSGSGANKTRIYTGDQTVLAFDTEAKARKWLPIYEEARRVYAEVKTGIRPESDLASYVEKNLPDSLKEFKNLFAKEGGGLNLNEPMYITPKGKSVDDMVGLANQYKHDPAGFINRPNSIHRILGPEDTLKYTGERNGPLLGISEKGTTEQPLINFKQAPLLDPASTMDQAMGSLMRGRYFDDIKYKFAEHYLSEFGDVLDASFRENIRDPFQGLMDAKFKTDYANRSRLAAAKNYRRSVMQLLGTKSEGQRDFDWIRQKIADSIYKNLGDQRLNLVAPYLLHRSVDAPGLLKQFGFHTKLGLFNPKQIFVQGAAVVHVAAIDGLPRALNAMGGGYMMSAAHFTSDPKILGELADRMVKLGWKKSDWLESYDGLMRSGFAKVGREVALQDGLFSARLRDSSVGKVLDAGTIPFNIGERAGRYTAWNSAYLKWRAENPGKTFTDKAIKEVLQRADLLTVNMSSAGNAYWQSGILGVPTQFFGYRARLMEQFLGKQLTTTEKARAFLTYATMFGIPVATTIPVALWPVNNSIKEWLQTAGYNPDENIVSKIANDGLGSMIIQSITGEDTNFETAIGPGPITQFHDLWQGDKSIAEIMGGASGTVFADMYASTTPLLKSIWSSLTDEKGPTNNIQSQDLIDLVQPYSTAKQATKAIVAYNYGVFYGKNRSVLEQVDNRTSAAILSGILGLDPQSLEDAYLKVDNLNAIKEVKKTQEKEATKYYRLGFEAIQNKNTEEATRYFERAGLAMDLGQFTPPERAQVMNRVTKNYQTTVQSIDWEFAKTSEKAMDAYRRKQQLQGK